jgi:Amt family ammonium transporter
MLWVGWYGFNAGSAVAADGIAANAFMTTTLAAAVAGFAWATVEWLARGKPTVWVLLRHRGRPGGDHAGAGFVTASGAVVIGILAGVIPFFASPSSRTPSATTTRSTPSACTRWAGRSWRS